MKLVKIERVDAGFVQKRRPGRLPARPDEDLDHDEYEKRIMKRENRKAAAKCRLRRIEKLDILKNQVSEIKNTNLQLLRENQNLQKELETLKNQTSNQSSLQSSPVYSEFDHGCAGELSPILPVF